MTQFELAVIYATKMHSGQKRKGSGAPYILHPIEVADIVSTVTKDEDIMTAAVLHDVLEDTAATEKEVVDAFGERVLALVKSETENKRRSLPPEATWRIRKEESLDELKGSSKEVKILWLGDKLSNMRSLYRGYVERGDDVFDIFHEKKKSEHAWYYKTVLEYLQTELGQTQAYQEFSKLVQTVFD